MPSKTIVHKGEPLAVSREQIKRRLMRSKRGDKRERDMRLYVEHVLGKPIEQWDLEELARGKVRNKNGRFTGGPRFQHISPLLDKEIANRLRHMALREIQGNVYTAIDVLIDLMKYSDKDDIKLKAALVVIEYTLGTPQQNINLAGDAGAVAATLAKALVMPGGVTNAHPVIEGSVVKDSEGDEEEGDELTDD